MPAPQELHVDRWLTDLSVAYVQENRDFVSDKVFPVVPVKNQSDKYVIYERGSFWRNQMRPRPLGGRADIADWTKTEGTYRVEEYALAHHIDDRQRANTDNPIQLDTQAMELLSSAVAIDADVRWATEYFADSIWTTDLEGAASADFTQINLTAGAHEGEPIELIDAQKEVVKKLTAKYPNTLTLGASAHRIVRNHSSVKEVLKYIRQSAPLNQATIADVFDIERYFVARAVYNTAAEGAADSFDFIAGAHNALMTYSPPAPGVNVPAAGYTFAWTDLEPGFTNILGGVIMRGRDDFAHSDIFEIRRANDIKLVSADLGVYFNGLTIDV
jgi:hypothetical protein